MAYQVTGSADIGTPHVIAGHAFIQNLRRGHYELAVGANRAANWGRTARRTRTPRGPG